MRRVSVIFCPENHENGNAVWRFLGLPTNLAHSVCSSWDDAFCGFGIFDEITYWSWEALRGSRNMLNNVKQNIHYLLHALANSAVMNSVNSTNRVVDVDTWWRKAFKAATAISKFLYCLRGTL